MRLSGAAVVAFIAAIAWFLGGVITITGHATQSRSVNTTVLNQTQYEKMDPAALRELWSLRRSRLAPTFAADFFLTLGSLLLVYVGVTLKRVHGGKSSRSVVKVMVMAFTLGALLPLLEFLQNLGKKNCRACLFVRFFFNICSFFLSALRVQWPQLTS